MQRTDPQLNAKIIERLEFWKMGCEILFSADSNQFSMWSAYDTAKGQLDDLFKLVGSLDDKDIRKRIYNELKAALPADYKAMDMTVLVNIHKILQSGIQQVITPPSTEKLKVYRTGQGREIGVQFPPGREAWVQNFLKIMQATKQNPQEAAPYIFYAKDPKKSLMIYFNTLTAPAPNDHIIEIKFDNEQTARMVQQLLAPLTDHRGNKISLDTRKLLDPKDEKKPNPFGYSNVRISTGTATMLTTGQFISPPTQPAPAPATKPMAGAAAPPLPQPLPQAPTARAILSPPQIPTPTKAAVAPTPQQVQTPAAKAAVASTPQQTKTPVSPTPLGVIPIKAINVLDAYQQGTSEISATEMSKIIYQNRLNTEFIAKIDPDLPFMLCINNPDAAFEMLKSATLIEKFIGDRLPEVLAEYSGDKSFNEKLASLPGNIQGLIKAASASPAPVAAAASSSSSSAATAAPSKSPLPVTAPLPSPIAKPKPVKFGPGGFKATPVSPTPQGPSADDIVKLKTLLAKAGRMNAVNEDQKPITRIIFDNMESASAFTRLLEKACNITNSDGSYKVISSDEKNHYWIDLQNNDKELKNKILAPLLATTTAAQHSLLPDVAAESTIRRLPQPAKISQRYTGRSVDTIHRRHNDGSCEIQGGRNSMEDYNVKASKEALAQAKNLTDEQLKQALIATYKDMAELTQKTQANPRPEYDHCGSTCLSVTAWRTPEGKFKTLTGNLGDGVALAITFDKGGNCSFTPLNKLHKPTDPDEVARIKQDGGQVFYGRVGAELGVARAFGDNSIDGVGKKPDVEVKEFSGEEGYVVLGCDGLLESLTTEDIARLLDKHRGKKPEEIAEILAHTAYDRGSTDNISVTVMKITNEMVSATNCDGHGGNIVANTVGEAFYPAFESKIQELVPQLQRDRQQAARLPSLAAAPHAGSLFQPAAPSPTSNLQPGVKAGQGRKVQ